MTKTTVRFGLVGCGRITKKHSEVLGEGHVAGGSIAAVCDPQTDRARHYGDKYGVPWFADMHEMCEKMGDQIDVLSVLTESGNHAKHVIELCKYGKHFVVEKPMALTIPDARRMIEACDRAGVRLFVVKQNRYNLPVQKLREATESGRFGKMVMGTVRVRWCRDQNYYNQDSWRGTWELDGGVLSNQASHHIDLLLWLMGDVESVFAYTATRLVNIEADDTAVAVVKFVSGALGIIEATTATRPKDLEGSISIMGENGTVEIGGFAVNEMKIWNFAQRTAGDDEVLSKYCENPPTVYGYGHARYLSDVVEAIQTGKGGVVDGVDGLQSLTLINAIYESMSTGREVVLNFSGGRSPLGRGIQR